MRLTTCIAIVAVLPALMSAAKAEPGTVALKPLKAVSLDLGARHLVGFFVKGEGRCDLTLLSADRFDDKVNESPTDIQRLRFQVDASHAVMMDSPADGALQLACAPDASSMTLTRFDRLAARATP